MGENLGGKDGDIVTSVALAGDVEVLLGVLWELFEEEGQQGIDILAGGRGVADRASAVGIANVDGLVEEDDRGIGVPRVLVVDDLDVVVNRGRAQLEEETGQGRAARAAVEPEDDGVLLGVITRLKEPWVKESVHAARGWWWRPETVTSQGRGSAE